MLVSVVKLDSGGRQGRLSNFFLNLPAGSNKIKKAGLGVKKGLFSCLGLSMPLIP